MPFALIVAGLIAVVVGVRDKQGDLFDLLKSDFTGQGSFVPWIIAVVAVGAVGYIKPLRPITDAFLVLILIGLFLSHGGFFNQFQSAINSASYSASNPLTQFNMQGVSKLPNLPSLNSLTQGATS